MINKNLIQKKSQAENETDELGVNESLSPRFHGSNENDLERGGLVSVIMDVPNQIGQTFLSNECEIETEREEFNH